MSFQKMYLLTRRPNLKICLLNISYLTPTPKTEIFPPWHLNKKRTGRMPYFLTLFSYVSTLKKQVEFSPLFSKYKQRINASFAIK